MGEISPGGVRLNMSTKVVALSRVLWDYLRIGAPRERREAIVAFGGHDLRVADWATQLWRGGWAPKLVLSGGLGYYTGKIWNEPEAQKRKGFAALLWRRASTPPRYCATSTNVHTLTRVLPSQWLYTSYDRHESTAMSGPSEES
jgi:hypothetical protein